MELDKKINVKSAELTKHINKCNQQISEQLPLDDSVGQVSPKQIFADPVSNTPQILDVAKTFPKSNFTGVDLTNTLMGNGTLQSDVPQNVKFVKGNVLDGLQTSVAKQVLTTSQSKETITDFEFIEEDYVDSDDEDPELQKQLQELKVKYNSHSK